LGEKRQFFAENWQKSQKIGIITLVPGFQIRHLRSGECMTFGTARKIVFMSPCSTKIAEQRWFFQKIVPQWAAQEEKDL
jgi:hypothetical protein